MKKTSDVAKVYCTTYCNQGHRLSDGKPVAHECFVLDPKSLEAERSGDFVTANLLNSEYPKKAHRGVRVPKSL